MTHLRDAGPYDLIYSVGSVPYLDPDRLLKVPGAIRDGMTSWPGGRSIPLGGSPGSTSLVRGC